MVESLCADSQVVNRQCRNFLSQNWNAVARQQQGEKGNVGPLRYNNSEEEVVLKQREMGNAGARQEQREGEVLEQPQYNSEETCTMSSSTSSRKMSCMPRKHRDVTCVAGHLM